MDPRATGASPINPISLRALMQVAASEELEQAISEDFLQWCEQGFNPLVQLRRARPLLDYRKERAREVKAEEAKKVVEIEKIEEAATRFQKNNPELNSKTLIILRSRITSSDTPEEVIQKVLETYPDPALADEAFNFLMETADSGTAEVIRLAREQFMTRFEKEVKAGRNMGAQAREFSEKGLGSPTSLREMYKDITQTPREPIKLFDELSNQFSYEKLKTVIRFLLHSLGADFRAKGPSIPRPELKRLIDETRSLQGILGIYRFFQSRMNLIIRQFLSYGIIKPPRLTFESLAKQFVKFLTERFMAPEKILQASSSFGIEKEAIAQLVVFTQMRDAIKQISPRYYRTPQQREELLQSFLKALETLEDQLEEEEEEEDDEKKRRKKPKQ